MKQRWIQDRRLYRDVSEVYEKKPLTEEEKKQKLKELEHILLLNTLKYGRL
jgi:hypothetical protein